MSCQCTTHEDVNLSLLREYFELEKSENSNLITILQKVQEIYGFLPRKALYEVSKETGIKEAKVYGVATFYSQFRLQPAGKYLIMLCQGTACHVNGSGLIEQALREILGTNEGEMTKDGLFTYINVACLGCCSLAPLMMINDQTYAKLTQKSIKEIIYKIRQEDETS